MTNLYSKTKVSKGLIIIERYWSRRHIQFPVNFRYGIFGHVGFIQEWLSAMLDLSKSYFRPYWIYPRVAFGHVGFFHEKPFQTHVTLNYICCCFGRESRWRCQHQTILEKELRGHEYAKINLVDKRCWIRL